MPKDVHAVPHGDKWAVKKEGSSRASSTHDTQKEAWSQAKETAKREQSEALLHGRDGRIRERNTYGKDPRSTKG